MSEWKSIGDLPAERTYCPVHKVYTIGKCAMCDSEERNARQTMREKEKAIREKLQWINQFRRK